MCITTVHAPYTLYHTCATICAEGLHFSAFRFIRIRSCINRCQGPVMCTKRQFCMRHTVPCVSKSKAPLVLYSHAQSSACQYSTVVEITQAVSNSTLLEWSTSTIKPPCKLTIWRSSWDREAKLYVYYYTSLSNKLLL